MKPNLASVCLFNLNLEVNFFLFFGVVLLGSCGTQRSQLIDNFTSYMSVAEVRQLLSPVELTELEISVLKGEEKLPLEQQYSSTMLVKTYQTLGMSGQLKLSFSYNYLWKTCFVTSEGTRYIKLLGERQHLHLKFNSLFGEWNAKTSISTMVSRQPTGNEICWYDVRLLEEEYYQNER